MDEIARCNDAAGVSLMFVAVVIVGVLSLLLLLFCVSLLLLLLLLLLLMMINPLLFLLLLLLKGSIRRNYADQQLIVNAADQFDQLTIRIIPLLLLLLLSTKQKE